MSRKTSVPPELPGFTYIEPLGAGGFADVFLYEQQMPRRKVAVKVLLADRLVQGAAQEFADEANVMAMLSTHPAIVTIYQAGVAGDGRPYLVMEYCPRPNLQLRVRRDPFSVAEALRVGIQVAGAVETAHRAGVMHRDIKPANILVTEYNRPALTDFGIASTAGALTQATGMSIPWSPPESFADPPQSGPRTDVYSLGATLFTLLVGRSPFEVVGGRNTGVDLMERIERSPVPAIARPDVPSSLQQAIARSMAKRADDRYSSAVAFARALQKIQIELSHSVTPIDIVDDHIPSEEIADEDDGLTRVRGVVSISPDDTGRTRPSATTTPSRPLSPAAPASHEIPRFDPADDATVVHARPTVIDDSPTIARAPASVDPSGTAAASALPAAPAQAVAPSPQKKARRALAIVLSCVAVLAVAATVVLANIFGQAPAATDATPTPTSKPLDVTTQIVPTVTELVGTREGTQVTFTWKNPSPEGGDSYLWDQVRLDGTTSPQRATTETASFEAPAGQTCVVVQLVREDGRASESLRGCVQ